MTQHMDQAIAQVLSRSTQGHICSARLFASSLQTRPCRLSTEILTYAWAAHTGSETASADPGKKMQNFQSASFNIMSKRLTAVSWKTPVKSEVMLDYG